MLTRDTSFDAIVEVQNSKLYLASAGTVNGGRYFVPTNRQFLNFNDPTPANGNIPFVPFITTNPVTNTITFNFGNFQDGSQRRPTTISLLLTLPVGGGCICQRPVFDESIASR